MRILRWAAPAAVITVAFVLRFWALGRPGELVFDELFYVRDAISQLAHGFPTTWPDDDPGMGGRRSLAFTDDPENAVHPPLGKWLIGLGVLVFGADNGWGWRSAVAVAGVATVAVTMRLGFLLSRSHVIGWMAGLLLAIDGVHVTLTRVGLLDGFLAFFIVLGSLFVWHDQLSQSGSARTRSRIRHQSGIGHRSDKSSRNQLTEQGSPTQALPITWHRPWLLAAGLTFGAAAAVKWSGLYPLACFLVLTTVWDTMARLHERSPHPLLRSGLQAGVTALIALPAAFLAYLSSWAGWIVNPGGWARTPGTPWPAALIEYHAEMLGWHGTLSAPHPYQAHPITWPLALRPTAMFEVGWDPEQGCAWSACVSGITALPNPIVTWAGAAALWVLAWLTLRSVRSARRAAALSGTASLSAASLGAASSGTASPSAVHSARDPLITAGVFVIVGYLSGWLPWLLTFSRSAVFQFYAVVLTPFSALALALVLGLLCGIPIRAQLSDPSSHDGARGAGGYAALPFSADASADADTLHSRRLAVACFLVVSVLLAVLFFPVWSGMPVARWFWQAHMWLPGWS